MRLANQGNNLSRQLKRIANSIKVRCMRLPVEYQSRINASFKQERDLLRGRIADLRQKMLSIIREVGVSVFTMHDELVNDGTTIKDSYPDYATASAKKSLNIIKAVKDKMETLLAGMDQSTPAVADMRARLQSLMVIFITLLHKGEKEMTQIGQDSLKSLHKMLNEVRTYAGGVRRSRERDTDWYFSELFASGRDTRPQASRTDAVKADVAAVTGSSEVSEATPDDVLDSFNIFSGLGMS